MFCGNCGKEIKVEADFCPYCGKQFGGDDSKQDDGQREAKQPSGRESVQRPRAGAKPSKKKIWIPLVLIVSLVVGYFGYQKVMEKGDHRYDRGDVCSGSKRYGCADGRAAFGTGAASDCGK